MLIKQLRHSVRTGGAATPSRHSPSRSGVQLNIRENLLLPANPPKGKRSGMSNNITSQGICNLRSASYRCVLIHPTSVRLRFPGSADPLQCLTIYWITNSADLCPRGNI